MMRRPPPASLLTTRPSLSPAASLLDLPPESMSVCLSIYLSVQVIIRGRHVSAWTYAHAFFVAGGNPTYKALLEDSQGMMERNLESLQGQMEVSAVQRQVLDDPEDMAKGLGPRTGAGAAAPGSAAKPGSGSGSRAAPAVGGAGGPAKSPASGSGGPGSSGSAGSAAAFALPAEVTTARSRLTDYRQKTTNLLAATDRFISELLEALEVGLLEDGAAYAAAYAAGAAGGAGAGAGGGLTRNLSSGSGSGARRKLAGGSDRTGGTKKARQGSGSGSDDDGGSATGSGSGTIDADAELAAALAAAEEEEE